MPDFTQKQMLRLFGSLQKQLNSICKKMNASQTDIAIALHKLLLHHLIKMNLSHPEFNLLLRDAFEKFKSSKRQPFQDDEPT